MEKPTITDTGAVFQAGDTIGTYLSQARKEIDARHGEGFAEAHPELLGACVQAQAIDFIGVSMSAAFYEIAEAIEAHAATMDSSLGGLGHSIESSR